MEVKDIKLNKADLELLKAYSREIEEETKELSDDELESQVQNELRGLLKNKRKQLKSFHLIKKTATWVSAISVAAAVFLIVLPGVEQQQNTADYSGYKSGANVVQADGCEIFSWQDGGFTTLLEMNSHVDKIDQVNTLPEGSASFLATMFPLL